MHDIFNSSVKDAYDYIIGFLVDIVVQLFPVFAPFIGIYLAITLFNILISPKHEKQVFDKEFESDFNLMYDMMSDNYDSEDDFINDYFSGFSSFDEPETDDFEFWESLAEDRYYDIETEFFEESEDEYSISFEEYESGTYIDYVEHSEEE